MTAAASIDLALQLLLSAITIWSVMLAGDNKRWAWAVALANQVLWFVWIVTAQKYGLLPMNVALTVVYLRNHVKWSRAANRGGCGP